MRAIQAALAAILFSVLQPAFAENTHIKSVPIQTVEQACAETDKRLAEIKAREAEEASATAPTATPLSAIRHGSSLANPSWRQPANTPSSSAITTQN